MFESLVGLQAWLAYRDHFFTVRQMCEEKGLHDGLPFIWHFGMWGDVLFISPLLAVIFVRFCRQWTLIDWVWTGLAGLAASAFLHNIYRRTTIPESHAYNGYQTPAGMLHMLYMSLGFNILLLFYFRSKEIGSTFLVTVSALLSVHILVGSHMLLGVLRPEWYSGRPLQSGFGWGFNVLVWGALIWRCHVMHVTISK
jgi:hypothetical protein